MLFNLTKEDKDGLRSLLLKIGELAERFVRAHERHAEAAEQSVLLQAENVATNGRLARYQEQLVVAQQQIAETLEAGQQRMDQLERTVTDHLRDRE